MCMCNTVQCTHTLTHMHTHTLTYTHSHTYTLTHTHTHSHTHTRTHTHMHAHTRTHTRTHTHTQTVVIHTCSRLDMSVRVSLLPTTTASSPSFCSDIRKTPRMRESEKQTTMWPENNNHSTKGIQTAAKLGQVYTHSL